MPLQMAAYIVLLRLPAQFLDKHRNCGIHVYFYLLRLPAQFLNKPCFSARRLLVSLLPSFDAIEPLLKSALNTLFSRLVVFTPRQ